MEYVAIALHQRYWTSYAIPMLPAFLLAKWDKSYIKICYKSYSAWLLTATEWDMAGNQE